MMINYMMFFFFFVPANLVTFSFGVYTGWPATVTPTLKSPQSTTLDHILTENSISWACSWGMISAILGTFFWGLLADKYGRKITGFLTMVPYLVSSIILLQVKTETALMISRFLGGFGASGAAINTPMYVGEISDMNMRAVLGSLFILMYNIGVLYVYVFGVFVGYDMLNWACLAVSILFMLVWCYVPESPIFLIQRDRKSEAKQSLKWLRGKDNDKEVEEEMDSLTHRGDQLTTATLKDYFDKVNVKAMLIGFVFQTGTQFSGINIILMNTVDVFKKSGSTLSAETCTILVGVVQVVASTIASYTVNKAGRKFFLILTYAMTAMALITMGWCFHVSKVDKDYHTGLLPILSLSLHVIAFSVGLGMVPYIIYTEIFPANVRNGCMSMLMFWNNVLGFGIVKAYPKIEETLHISGCFWLFGAVCLAVVPYTYFFVPETKDKTFDEIRQKMLLWFPDLSSRNKVAITNPADKSKDVVVESSVQKVYMEKNQNCFKEP